MKIFPVHSIVDIISNSSSELFIVRNSSSVKETIKELIDISRLDREDISICMGIDDFIDRLSYCSLELKSVLSLFITFSEHMYLKLTMDDINIPTGSIRDNLQWLEDNKDKLDPYIGNFLCVGGGSDFYGKIEESPLYNFLNVGWV